MRTSWDYTKLYGKNQQEIYFTLRELGYDEKKIQKLYKIPQPSLRRCRHLWKKTHELTWNDYTDGRI